jgi:P-type Ca2+ transporter type 2C
LSELFVILLTSFLGLKYALIPLQILYINLITDVLPALALGVTRGSREIMMRPPRNPNEPIIDRSRWTSIVVYALIIAGCSLGAVLFGGYFVHEGEELNAQLCNNTLFITLILSQLWNVLNMTNDTKVSLFRTDVFQNRYIWYAISACAVLTFSLYFVAPVAKALALYMPSINDLLVMFGFSLLSLLIIRTLKRIQLIR